MGATMAELWAAAAFFLGLHLLVSGTSLRGKIVGVIGENLYLLAFSVASLVGIVWLVRAYGQALAGPNHLYWAAPEWLLHLAPLVMIVAFVFVVLGVTTPNPMAVKAESLADKPDAVRGMLRITRHPLMWGFMFWAGMHVAVNGDKAAILFFGTFLLLAALGTISQDEKKARSMGESWKHFASQTSNLPFAAILAGRNKLKPGEIGLWRLALALVIFGGVFYGHLRLFGVSPVPGWAPY